MPFTRREFLKKLGIVAGGVAVATVAPSALLSAPSKVSPHVASPVEGVGLSRVGECVTYLSNGEQHFDAPCVIDDKHLQVYHNNKLCKLGKDYTVSWATHRETPHVSLTTRPGDTVSLVRYFDINDRATW